MERTQRSVVEREPNWSTEELLQLHDLVKKEKKSPKEVATLLHRSRRGVIQKISHLQKAEKVSSLEEWIEYCNRARIGKEVNHVFATVVLGTKELNQETKQNGANQLTVSTNLNEALSNLEYLMDALNKAIEDVAYFAMQEKVEEFKKEKEAEITALKTVVNAAKSNNLVTNLKRRLMGNK